MVLASPADASELDPASLEYPLVLKPSRSVNERDGQRVALGVRHVASADALRESISALGEAAFPLLVQQRVVGPGIGIFLLIWDGELLATFAHRRLREKPPSGGVSVYSESVAADAELVAICSARCSSRMHWRGVAMVEFKRDARTGTAYLMEVNGRFLGIAAARDRFRRRFSRVARGGGSGRATRRDHRLSRGLAQSLVVGDVDHLLARWRKDAVSLALPAGAPSRLRATLDFLRFWLRTTATKSFD